MISEQITIRRIFLSYQVDKIFLVLAGMFVFPFIVHLIPWSSSTPLGAIFLPIFYVPLVSVYLYRKHVPLIAATFSPLLNHLLIGMPRAEIAYGLTFELITFIVLLQLIKKVSPRFWLNGTVSFIGAKMLSEVFLKSTAVSPTWSAGVFSAGIGIAMLTIINFLMIRIQAE